MEQAFGVPIEMGDLRCLVGDFQQVAGIREMRFANGPESGARLLQIRNAAGLCVELLPDRCLDIGQVWLHGVPFAWMGPGGLPSRSGVPAMDEALGGLMTTCGFDHIRAAETVAGHPYPQHGSMARRPARLCSAKRVDEPQGSAFVVEAETVHASLKGSEYRLFRRIEIPFSKNEIRLADRLSVVRPAASFALYHVNLGYPLISDSTAVTTDGTARDELFEAEPNTHAARAPAAPYRVEVQARHGSRRLSFGLQADGRELPWLQTHRRAEPGINLFCVEPVTHAHRTHAELLAAEARPFPPQRAFTLSFQFRVDSSG